MFKILTQVVKRQDLALKGVIIKIEENNLNLIFV